METLLPCLDVRGPDGQHFNVVLEKDRMTIGRFDLYEVIEATEEFCVFQ